MLVIPKKKNNLTRLLIWGGLILIVGGLIVSTWIGKLCLIFIIVGGIIFTVGAYIKHELFRCPKCGEKLLMGFDFLSLKVIFERCPEFCPQCSTRIEIKKE